MLLRVVVLLALVPVVATAQDPAVLDVVGRGAEGRVAYDGGGRLRFEDATLGAQVVHYDGDGELLLPLAIAYEVLEPAPIVLTSSMGTEYWYLYHFDDATLSALYTRESCPRAGWWASVAARTS